MFSTEPPNAPSPPDLPPIPTLAQGPVYLLAEYSGVLEVTENGAQRVLPCPKEGCSSYSEINVSPAGQLGLTDFQGVHIHTPQGTIDVPRALEPGPKYKFLVMRSDKDVWAVTDTNPWELMHYDGTS